MIQGECKTISRVLLKNKSENEESEYERQCGYVLHVPWNLKLNVDRVINLGS